MWYNWLFWNLLSEVQVHGKLEMNMQKRITIVQDTFWESKQFHVILKTLSNQEIYVQIIYTKNCLWMTSFFSNSLCLLDCTFHIEKYGLMPYKCIAVEKMTPSLTQKTPGRAFFKQRNFHHKGKTLLLGEFKKFQLLHDMIWYAFRVIFIWNSHKGIPIIS